MGTRGTLLSVSRRTDIPAFYGPWFLNRLTAGFAGWENPFGGQKYVVSLKPGDVAAFAFWSKNYRPFLPILDEVHARRFPAVFNYTITGLPRLFESGLVETDDAIDSLSELARRYSPEHINWRYDPIVLSPLTPPEYHVERFAALCAKLQGQVRRCVISYVCRYGKVERNVQRLERDQGLVIRDPPLPERRALASRLAEIAARHGIALFTCCGDDLIGERIHKARCVDGSLLSRLYGIAIAQGRAKPTRPACGCTPSTDIGKYDTCPHGCVYCYANINREKAEQAFRAHDPDSAFLGASKEQSDRWLADIAARQKEARGPHQGELSLGDEMAAATSAAGPLGQRPRGVPERP